MAIEPPQDILDEPYGVAAFRIFAESWHARYAATTIEESSHQLRQVIVDSEDVEEAVYCAVNALHRFACKAPSALDHALDILGQGLSQLPETPEFSNGKRVDDAFDILKWWFIEWSARFRGSAYSSPADHTKHSKSDAEQTKDCTNVYFEASELVGSSGLDGVLERVRNLQSARLEFVVAKAMQARSHSKGISHLSCTKFAIPLINNALEPSTPGQIPIWGKTELVGSCVLLRGCARTLIDKIPAESREQKIAEWIEKLGKFLYYDPCGTMGGDFILKIHVAVCLSPWRWRCLLTVEENNSESEKPG